MPLFGTDGVRGVYGEHPITEAFCDELIHAVITTSSELGLRPRRVLLGSDTRPSREKLVSSFVDAFSLRGIDVMALGVVPSPLLAYSVANSSYDLGLMVTASHNPSSDNGFKFFNAEGRKFPVIWEERVERHLGANDRSSQQNLVVGSMKEIDSGLFEKYRMACAKVLREIEVNYELTIVVDCANGAWSETAPALLSAMGFHVIPVGQFDKSNQINDGCGSTSPRFIRDQVLMRNADLGIAFDGDGDRLIMVDHLGNTVNGDQILYLLAKDAKERGEDVPGVVGTVMTNGALNQVLQEQGISFSRTAVGDRNVMEEMEARGWHLGGETSGHVINSRLSPAGDGLFTAIQVLATICRTKRALNELLGEFVLFDQVHGSVVMNDTSSALEDPSVQAIIEKIRSRDDVSQVVVRPSGTEPVVRIMVEGVQLNKVKAYVESIRRSLVKAST